jgi:hypothetical protein
VARVIARILLWNLASSKTTLAELREHLPELDPGDAWVANEAQERFGLIAFGEEVPDLSHVRALIGEEPAVAEEFDVLDD